MVAAEEAPASLAINQRGTVYYPNIYGRRFELLAIREQLATRMSNSKGQQVIYPVIEPVKEDLGDLQRCLSELSKGSTDGRTERVFVVTNPTQGDFGLLVGDPSSASAYNQLQQLVMGEPSAIPAFKVQSGTALKELQDFVASIQSPDIGIAISTPSLGSSSILQATSSKNVTFFLDESLPNTEIASYPKASSVIIRDSFVGAANNCSYPNASFFSGHHMSDPGAGYAGYGDHTILKGQYSSGGGIPKCIAIHLTYTDSRSLYVRHFTSIDSGIFVANWADVLGKISTEVANNPNKFISTPGLQGFLDLHAAQSHTGLGKSKQHQICHHVLTVGKSMNLI